MLRNTSNGNNPRKMAPNVFPMFPTQIGEANAEELSLPTTSERTPLLEQDAIRPTLIGSPERPAPDKHARFGLKNFLADIKNIRSATVPMSIVIAIVIGVLCGIAAFLYYTVLEFLLELLWREMPETLARAMPNFWPESMHWLWIPFMGMTCAVLVGVSIVIMGFPGDLPYTVKCVHKLGYVPLGHAPAMVATSQISILGGGSLGPEAPLVAICASIAGWISMDVLKHKHKNVVRKHTLCGMACALAAFFGVPLGGSLFALEINNRLGYEYFEHAIEAILSGVTCLVVFRSLARLPIGPIWWFSDDTLKAATPTMVLIGVCMGLVGAGIASLFAHFHWFVLKNLNRVGWHNSPVKLSIFGGVGICLLGVLIPQTMFWGEYELGIIGALKPASALPHIWPTTGLTGFEITGWFSALLVGIGKIIAISFTVAGGYRGGFIFPFFCAGAAFGRAVCFIFPSIPPPVAMLCIAAGINVAITRTSLATPLILCALAGEGNITSVVLAASLTSLFATYYMVSNCDRFVFSIDCAYFDLTMTNLKRLFVCIHCYVAIHWTPTRSRGHRRSAITFVHRKGIRRRRRISLILFQFGCDHVDVSFITSIFVPFIDSSTIACRRKLDEGLPSTHAYKNTFVDTILIMCSLNVISFRKVRQSFIQSLIDNYKYIHGSRSGKFVKFNKLSCFIDRHTTLVPPLS